MSLIIAGDIGGTKTTMGLYEQTEQETQCIKQETYCSHDFNQFGELMHHFIESIDVKKPISKCGLSLAGPVINQTCKATNLPWQISARDLEETFRFQSVNLLNDIEACGYGLIHGNQDELVQINPAAVSCEAHRAIVSVGTGLGQAFLYWDGQGFTANASEGGHGDFAPMYDEDIPFWQYLHKRYPGHVSHERVVSGPGIEEIYQFLCQHHEIRPQAPAENASAWISSRAIEQSDPLCIATMGMFTRFLATEAANLALKVLARGGVYLTGGIIPKIEPLLRTPEFLEQFQNKGRFRGMLQDLPVWLSRDQQLPLKGALYASSQVISNN